MNARQRPLELILDKRSSLCSLLRAVQWRRFGWLRHGRWRSSARHDCAALVALALLVSGCSAEQVYNAAAGWRRNECNRIGDAQQRERCLKEEADRSYDAYRKALPPPQ